MYDKIYRIVKHSHIISRTLQQHCCMLRSSPELLDDVDAEPVEHLSNGGHLTLQEDCHRPSVVVSHGVQEPAAGGRRGIELEEIKYMDLRVGSIS